MASSRKSKPNSAAGLEAAVGAALGPVLFPGARLALGLSGGVDSVTLLDVLRRLAGPLNFRLSCVHVNHQISPNAQRWASFCARLCRRRGIALTLHRVDVAPHRAEGLEAAARRVRYQVYAEQRDVDFIVLAQHQDDQAETLLLQLLRGAGVKGGAAMPLLRSQPVRGRGEAARAPAILRPMLALTRAKIEAYARAHRLSWVEDESNADTGRDRNFLRHQVLPVIGRAFPAYRVTLARAAAHLGEAAQLLDQLAAADAQRVVKQNTLALAALQRLGDARAKNLLRWLLSQHGATAPETDRLQEGLRQLFEARDDAAVRVALGERELRRYAGRAYLLPVLPQPPADMNLAWDGRRVWPVPELGGILLFARRRGAGIACARVQEQGLSLRLRQGGEKLRLRARGATRSLKNLLQEARLPPWERERLPLLYCGDALVALPGLGVASGWTAGSGEYGWVARWRLQD